MDAETKLTKRRVLEGLRDRMNRYEAERAAVVAQRDRELQDLDEGYLRALDLAPKIELELKQAAEREKAERELARNADYQELQRLAAQVAALQERLK